jgi:glycerol-3-phosphate dehydrogenase (NAD(P)+)
MVQRVSVVGAGSWGTTMAAIAATNSDTRLWARRAEVADEIMQRHTNSGYIGDHVLPESLIASHDLASVVGGAQVVALAVPSHGFREIARRVAMVIDPGVPILSLTKGLERATQLRMSEVARECFAGHPVAVLSGPNLAREICAGQPAASVVACADIDVARSLAAVFSRPTFRLYTNPDVVGCEIAGVVKNVIAIGAGIAQGLGLGDNAKATVITRGLAEMTRLGVALGARAETFPGLAGLGDLVATCASMQSRNTQVGIRLGKGERITDIAASMNMVAEGVQSSSLVVALARRHGVEMPIAERVAAVCDGTATAMESLMELMSRSVKGEFE